MQYSQSNFCPVTADFTSGRQFLLDLFSRLAYREGDFLLSSGVRSSYYINAKEVTLHPQGSLTIGRLLLSMVPEGTQGVAGLTLGADPIVTAVTVVSAMENRPILGLIVRKQPKGHGTKVYIEGPSLVQGAQVVVLEDVVTTGKSAMVAVERLRTAGYTVDKVIALVDRDEGGTQLYQSAGLDFRALFSLVEIKNQCINQLK